MPSFDDPEQEEQFHQAQQDEDDGALDFTNGELEYLCEDPPEEFFDFLVLPQDEQDEGESEEVAEDPLGEDKLKDCPF